MCSRTAIAGNRYCIDHSDCTIAEVYTENRKQIRVIEDQRTQSKKKK